VGWALKAKCGRKRVTLELGGNAGAIVHRDADVSHAAHRCVYGAFAFSGQVCISLQRIFVHKDIAETFTEEFVSLTKKLKVGNPAEEDTDIGPMVDAAEAERAGQWIDEAVRGGAKLLCGGGVNGAMMEPAVLTGTSPEMKINCLEAFAPVVTISVFDDIGDAIRAVDDSEFGLQAGIFTNDAAVIERAARDIEVGGLMVNEAPTYRVDHMPYGGVKLSGTGREGVRFAIEEMMESRFIAYC